MLEECLAKEELESGSLMSMPLGLLLSLEGLTLRGVRSLIEAKSCVEKKFVSIDLRSCSARRSC